jgi:hypothetical protein
VKKPARGGLWYIFGMTFAISLFLKPFFMFVLTACVLYPARRAVMIHMKEGQLKNVLLFRIGGNGVKWNWKLAALWSTFLVSYLAFLVYLAIP